MGHRGGHRESARPSPQGASDSTECPHGPCRGPSLSAVAPLFGVSGRRGHVLCSVRQGLGEVLTYAPVCPGAEPEEASGKKQHQGHRPALQPPCKATGFPAPTPTAQGKNLRGNKPKPHKHPSSSSRSESWSLHLPRALCPALAWPPRSGPWPVSRHPADTRLTCPAGGGSDFPSCKLRPPQAPRWHRNLHSCPLPRSCARILPCDAGPD